MLDSFSQALSGVGRCFIVGGLTIGGVSIYFNVGGSGGILPQEISNFLLLCRSILVQFEALDDRHTQLWTC